MKLAHQGEVGRSVFYIIYFLIFYFSWWCCHVEMEKEKKYGWVGQGNDLTNGFNITIHKWRANMYILCIHISCCILLSPFSSNSSSSRFVCMRVYGSMEHMEIGFWLLRCMIVADLTLLLRSRRSSYWAVKCPLMLLWPARGSSNFIYFSFFYAFIFL